MATYLELCRTTRLMVGMQGVGPASVIDAQGVEEVLVRFVRDAYVDIQNLREEWNWLLTDGSFSTNIGQDEYDFLAVFISATPEFKKYKLNSLRITNSGGKKGYLKYIDRDVLEARYLNTTEQKLPTQYAVDPSNNSLLLKPIPDAVYTVDFRYWKSPEILALDATIPALPISFHNLIAYKAVEKMAVYLGASEVYSRYASEAARMTGQLMRLEIPKMRMTAGALV